MPVNNDPSVARANLNATQKAADDQDSVLKTAGKSLFGVAGFSQTARVGLLGAFSPEVMSALNDFARGFMGRSNPSGSNADALE